MSYTIRARLLAASGAPLTGPTVYAYRYRHGEAGQAVGPDHPAGAGYLEIHTDLDAEEQWISGDVTLDGVRRFVEPFHRSLLDSGRTLEMRVGADGVVRVSDPGAVVVPGPGPTPAGGGALRRDGRVIRDASGAERRLRGIGLPTGLTNGARPLSALVRIAADHGLDLVRVFSAIKRTDDYVSPWTRTAEWTARLAEGLTVARDLGVYVQLVIGDDADRNGKPDDRESPWNGKDPLKGSTAEDTVKHHLSLVPVELRPYLIPEVWNEPSYGSSLGAIESKMLAAAHALGYSLVLNCASGDHDHPAGTDGTCRHYYVDKGAKEGLPALLDEIAADRPCGLDTDGPTPKPDEWATIRSDLAPRCAMLVLHKESLEFPPRPDQSQMLRELAATR